MKNFLIVLLVLMPSVIFAQDGTLDSSFGINGYAYNQSIANKSYYFKSLAKQNDGKILQAGVVRTLNDSNIFLSRLLLSGSLDTNFANGGYFEHGDTLTHTKAQKVLVLPDDKILVGANHLSAGINSFLLMKLNVNGVLDSSFGNNGVVNISSAGKALKNIMLQSTGKIIIQADSFLYRLNTNGGIDITFGNLGKMSVGNLTLFVVQDDDKIIGIKRTDLFVRRFLPEGGIDSAYAVNGTYYRNTTTNLPVFVPPTNYTIQNALQDSSEGLVFYANWSSFSGLSSFSGYLIGRITNTGVRDSLYERLVQQSGGGAQVSIYDPYHTDHRTLLLMQRNQKLVNVQFCRTQFSKAIVLLKRFYQRPFFGTDTSFNHKGWGSADYPNNIIIDYNEPGDAVVLDDSSILVLAKYGSNSNSFVCKFKTSQYSYQPQAPSARIGLSQVYGVVSVSKIQLFDSSLYYPSNRTWTITPGNYQFQDGTSITSQNPKVIFTQTGKYDIKLVVWNAVGKDSTIINQAIDIGNNPVANFGATALVSDTTMILGLIDSSLYNPAYRKWTISAPNFVFVNSSDTSANPNVRFTQSGFYTVKLWVKSLYGVDSITKQNYFTVVNTSSPVANFESDNQQVRQDSIVRFFDKSIFTPQSRRWVFSPSTFQYLQGTDSSSVNPVVKFNAVGNYTVKLIVSNNQGIDSLTKNNYIHVGLPPQANFGVSQTQGTLGTEVDIVDSSLNQVASREWEIIPNTFTYIIGNNTSSSIRVRFDSAGSYSVKLRVQNRYGADSMQINNSINIIPVGLKESILLSELTLIPNPATENILIEWTVFDVQEILIIDNMGRQVKCVRLNENCTNIYIDISGIDDGIYNVLIKTSKGLISKKITKLKQ